MKKFFQNSIITTLVCFFLTSATGFNVAHFCCNTCAEHGFIEVFLTDSCSDLHFKHQHDEKAENHCCSHESDDEKGISATSDNCSLTRISTAIYDLQKQIKINPDFVFGFIKLNFSISEFIVKSDYSKDFLTIPPLLSGRTILEKISTFII